MRPRASLLIRGRRQTGQTVVEFALAGTMFLLLLIGMMNMAYAVYCYTTICSAARAAVRYAIVHGPDGPSPATTDQIQQAALKAAPGVSLKKSNVTVSWPTDPNLSTKKDAQVKISFNYMLSLPPFKNSLTLTTTSRMLVSQ